MHYVFNVCGGAKHKTINITLAHYIRCAVVYLMFTVVINKNININLTHYTRCAFMYLISTVVLVPRQLSNQIKYKHTIYVVIISCQHFQCPVKQIVFI